MTIVKRHNGSVVRTERCALCGARRGEDFKEFPSHLGGAHTPADAGLGRREP